VVTVAAFLATTVAIFAFIAAALATAIFAATALMPHKMAAAIFKDEAMGTTRNWNWTTVATR
jgi:hypothetical protein